MRPLALMLAAALVFVGPASKAQDPQDPDAKDPKEEEFKKKVNDAIDKGVQWLISQHKEGTINQASEAELILLALFHGGLGRDHPFLVANTRTLLSKNISQMYNVGVRALLLEKIDRKKYQAALGEVTFWLAQAQAKNGQWGYAGVGNPVGPVPVGYAPPPKKKKEPPKPGETTSDDEGPRPNDKPLRLPPYKPGNAASGDNSNSQYALLGLFAAARANVEIPKQVLQKAEQWFESCQNSDGGWGYRLEGVDNDPLVGNQSSGSMTTAGLTALIVAKFYQGKDWQKDAKVQKGLDWLGSNLKYDHNPGGGDTGRSMWQYYWLYGLERVGQITGLKEFGGHDWYKEGAEYLLGAQQADGRWSNGKSAQTNDRINTAFAILFLRKATPELKRPKDIATGDTRNKPEPKPEEKPEEE